MKKEEIKAIVFDVGGVLALGKENLPHRGHHILGVHEYMAKKLKVDLDSWFDSIEPYYAKSVEGEISKKEAVSHFSQNLNVSEAKFTRLFNKGMPY